MKLKMSKSFAASLSHAKVIIGSANYAFHILAPIPGIRFSLDDAAEVAVYEDGSFTIDDFSTLGVGEEPHNEERLIQIRQAALHWLENPKISVQMDLDDICTLINNASFVTTKPVTESGRVFSTMYFLNETKELAVAVRDGYAPQFITKCDFLDAPWIGPVESATPALKRQGLSFIKRQ